METVFEKPLNGEIGNLSNLTTTAKTDLVSAVNEVKGAIPDVINNLTSDSTTSALSAAQGKSLNSNKVQYLGQITTGSTLEDCLDNALSAMTLNNAMGYFVYGGYWYNVIAMKNNNNWATAFLNSYKGITYTYSCIKNNGTWSIEQLALNNSIFASTSAWTGNKLIFPVEEKNYFLYRLTVHSTQGDFSSALFFVNEQTHDVKSAIVYGSSIQSLSYDSTEQKVTVNLSSNTYWTYCLEKMPSHFSTTV